MTTDSGTTADVDRWWTALVTTALVGTARTSAPPLPDLGAVARPGSTAEVALLDATALGGVLRLAGRPIRTTPLRTPPGTPSGSVGGECPPDATRPAPDRAVQLLRLALTQPPVGRHLQDEVVAHWLRAAAAHHRRLPHELLPLALAAATTGAGLREPLRAVLDERGRWLAARRTDWSWAVPATGTGTATTGPRPSDDPAGPHTDAADGLPGLREVRAADPARGRALVEQELGSASAKRRTALIAALGVGLGPDDEDLLMTALADKAVGVHRAAGALLDALPRSARARRLGSLLAAAISTHGILRARLEVADLPDPGGDVRTDRSTPEPGSAGWQPWLLEQVVAGAPLSVLTAATRTDPAGVLRLDRDKVLRAGLRRAVLARRDEAWARAMLADGWDPALVALLPAREQEAAVTARLQSSAADAAAVVAAASAPWGPDLSLAVVEWCVRTIGTGAQPAPIPVQADVLGRGLDPRRAPAVRAALQAAETVEAEAARAAAAGAGGDRGPGPASATHSPATATSPAAQLAANRLAVARHNVRVLRDVTQFLSFTHSIDEAFL